MNAREHIDIAKLHSRRSTTARQARDKAIRAAVDDGMSYREVAAAIGLSHSRVAQIVGGK